MTATRPCKEPDCTNLAAYGRGGACFTCYNRRREGRLRRSERQNQYTGPDSPRGKAAAAAAQRDADAQQRLDDGPAPEAQEAPDAAPTYTTDIARALDAIGASQVLKPVRELLDAGRTLDEAADSVMGSDSDGALKLCERLHAWSSYIGNRDGVPPALGDLARVNAAALLWLYESANDPQQFIMRLQEYPDLAAEVWRHRRVWEPDRVLTQEQRR